MQELTCGTTSPITDPTLIPRRPIPPRPQCPSWCSAAACQLVHDESWAGWAGLHADELREVTTPDTWWGVQIQAFASAEGDAGPGIVLDTDAQPGDWMTPDEAEALAAALLDAAACLRAATAVPAVLRAA